MHRTDEDDYVFSMEKQKAIISVGEGVDEPLAARGTLGCIRRTGGGRAL